MEYDIFNFVFYVMISTSVFFFQEIRKGSGFFKIEEIDQLLYTTHCAGCLGHKDEAGTLSDLEDLGAS